MDAASYGIRTGVVAERFGGQVLDTMSIENYISVLETDGPKFAAALDPQLVQRLSARGNFVLVPMPVTIRTPGEPDRQLQDLY